MGINLDMKTGFILLLFFILISSAQSKGQSDKQDYLNSEYEYLSDTSVYLNDEVLTLNDLSTLYNEEFEYQEDLFLIYEQELDYFEDKMLYLYSDSLDGFEVLLLDTQEYLSSEIFPSDLFLMNPATADILKGSVILVGIIVMHSVFPGVGWAIPFISTFQQEVSTAIFATRIITATVACGVASVILETTIDWANDGVIDDGTFYEGFANGYKWAAYAYAFEMGIQSIKYQFSSTTPSKGLLSPEHYNRITGRKIINEQIDDLFPPEPIPGATYSPEYMSALKTGVPLVNGQRDFSKFARGSFSFKSGILTGDVSIDNRILKRTFGVSLDDFPDCTLHHAPDGRTLQMVPTDLHQAIRHTGGNAYIKAFTDAMTSEFDKLHFRDYSVAVTGGNIIGRLEGAYE